MFACFAMCGPEPAHYTEMFVRCAVHEQRCDEDQQDPCTEITLPEAEKMPARFALYRPEPTHGTKDSASS